MRVYRVTHKASGKVYIGATTRPLDERMARHFAAALSDKRQGLLYDAIRLDGINAFAWDVLHEYGTEAEMWQAERQCIVEFKSREPDGFNQTHGGLGGGWQIGRKRGPMSEVERRKRSIAQKGRRAWNKGLPHTFKAREKMRGRATWNKGVPRTEAEKAAMRAGIQKSRTHGQSHPMCKPIQCDDVTYQSVRDMERRTGLSRAGIYYRLSKGRATFVP